MTLGADVAKYSEYHVSLGLSLSHLYTVLRNVN